MIRLLAVILAAAPAAAGAASLSLEAAAAEALRSNPELSAAQETVRSASLRYCSGYSSFLPQISADAGYSESRVGTMPGDGSYSMGLTARQSLFSGWADKARLDQYRAQLRSAEASYQDTAARVGFELKSAFARLLYAQENLKLSETIPCRGSASLIELSSKNTRDF